MTAWKISLVPTEIDLPDWFASDEDLDRDNAEGVMVERFTEAVLEDPIAVLEELGAGSLRGFVENCIHIRRATPGEVLPGKCTAIVHHGPGHQSESPCIGGHGPGGEHQADANVLGRIINWEGQEGWE